MTLVIKFSLNRRELQKGGDGTRRVHPLDGRTLAALYKSMVAIRGDGSGFDRAMDVFLDTAVLPPPPDREESVFRFSDVLPRDAMEPEDVDVTAVVNHEGRVERLTLQTWHRTLALPACIGSLERLRTIEFDSCTIGSLPEASLSKLPNLVGLELGSTRLLDDFPFGMELPRLGHLILGRVDLPSSAKFFAWVRDCLPSLESLGIWGYRSNHPLIDEAVGFPSTLRNVELRNCAIDENQLEILLFDILPRHRGIEFVNLRRNRIRSFRSVRERLGTVDKNWIGFRSRLETLLLETKNQFPDDPEETETDDSSRDDDKEEEAAAICEFLEAFSNIRTATWHVRASNRARFEMLLNWGGRSLLESRCVDRPLPIAAWPVALGRLNKRADRSQWMKKSPDAHASALYALLRNGPVFSGMWTTGPLGQPNREPPRSH